MLQRSRSKWAHRQRMIFKHYRQLVRPKEAERYWNIKPATENKVVPLVAHGDAHARKTKAGRHPNSGLKSSTDPRLHKILENRAQLFHGRRNWRILRLRELIEEHRAEQVKKGHGPLMGDNYLTAWCSMKIKTTAISTSWPRLAEVSSGV